MVRLKSEELEPTVIKLSSLLQYMLYDSDDEKVLLKNEIESLQNYIALQKLRFTSKLNLQVHINVIEEWHAIEPMLLIPFVENAFKHASNKINEKIWITIDLIIRGDMLNFTVENSVFPEGKTQTQNNHPGIGLGNVKRRLSLLYEDHTLNHELKDNYYHSFLQIPLS